MHFGINQYNTRIDEWELTHERIMRDRLIHDEFWACYQKQDCVVERIPPISVLYEMEEQR